MAPFLGQVHDMSARRVGLLHSELRRAPEAMGTGNRHCSKYSWLMKVEDDAWLSSCSNMRDSSMARPWWVRFGLIFAGRHKTVACIEAAHIRSSFVDQQACASCVTKFPSRCIYGKFTDFWVQRSSLSLRPRRALRAPGAASQYF